MSNSLLEEAIVDAQKLRELAEQTAKNRIIEAVMPQIREMVNRRILGESLEELAQEEMAIEEEVAEASEPKRQEESEEETKKEALAATDPAKVGEALNELFESVKKTKILTESVASIEAKVSKIAFLVKDDTFLRENAEAIANKIIDTTDEAVNLMASMNLNENSTNDSLSKRLDQSIKELKDMSRKNRSIFDFLFEGKELNEAKLKLELEGEEELDDEVVEMLRAAGIEVEEAAGGDDDDLLDDEEVEVNPEEESEEPEEAEEEVEESSYMEMDYNEGNEMYELDETLLRRQLRRIRENAAAEQADQFGGGKVLGDVILDIDEEDLINVLADELGKYQGVKEPMLPESRRRAPAGPSSRERQLQRQLKEARTEATDARRANAKLQQQLQEMNLFNAKLLYANKLMQNKELTVKQQKTVVEALDNAKTLREAKLLFESLTESLTRKPAAAGSLKEGMTRTFGSSSKSTRSAAPANASGVDSDRWAILAGIGKG